MNTNALGLMGVVCVFFLLQSCRVAKDDECRTLEVKITQIGSDQLQAVVKNGLGPFSYKWTHGLGDFPSISVSESGDYSVTVTDHGNACTKDASFSFIKASGNGCGSSNAVMDAENNLYDIVTIGTQCWMKSNVVIEAGIPKVSDETEWNFTTNPAWCYYNNDINNSPKYGKLYNWYAAKSGKLCPAGWHIPSMAEWETLINFLGKDSLAAIAMKKVDPLWTGTINASNSSGFSALPGGRMQPGGFIYEGRDANFWATDESNFPGSAKAITLTAGFDGITRIDWGKSLGFSCRCVKD
ncbi:MAG: fibrobacter succinogenes major paralogous domain-containing protein [Saprospiraceae bacterium]|nr:fibrobacter succinogenes major paralogous domain-containing protein [Saprospiraceae bacterium]